MSNINADDLRELKKLLDEGVISQEEFDKKKAEFLDEDFQDKDSLAKEKSANFTKQSTSENEVNSKDEKYPQSKKNDSNENSNDDENQDNYPSEEKKSKSSSSKSTAIVIVGIVAIIAIFAMYMNNKNKEEQANQSTKPTEQSQTIESSQESNVTNDWKDFDNKSWSDFKDINQKYIDLKNTVKDMSNPERKDAINQAKQYFTDKENSLDYGKNDDQNKYLDRMKNICQQAKSVCDDAINSSNSESELSNIKDKLAGIEDEMSNIANKRPDLLKKAGYTEEEIKEIIEKIKGDLGMN